MGGFLLSGSKYRFKYINEREYGCLCRGLVMKIENDIQTKLLKYNGTITRKDFLSLFKEDVSNSHIDPDNIQNPETIYKYTIEAKIFKKNSRI